MNDITHIGQLTPDGNNARKHNPRNIGLISDALREVGAARSIVIDETGTILAGNGVVEAAAEAGIERVRVIDADGEEIIAVRRSGLTADQKTRLALFDNRAAELATWEGGVLAALKEQDERLLAGLFTEGEIDAILAALPSGDDWADALVGLPSGDKAPFQQMTFTLSDAQAAQVQAAMDRARGMGPFIDTGNENGNGNALARICETFLGVARG